MKMVTGDHTETVQAVAAMVGLAEPGAHAIDGTRLAELSDEALREVRIFARVSPSDKLRIVQQLRAAGQIVAVTETGSTTHRCSMPSTWGAAMRRSATDVASGMPLPFLPAQSLWLNVVTNGVTDLALAMEPAEAFVGLQAETTRSGDPSAFPLTRRRGQERAAPSKARVTLDRGGEARASAPRTVPGGPVRMLRAGGQPPPIRPSVTGTPKNSRHPPNSPNSLSKLKDFPSGAARARGKLHVLCIVYSENSRNDPHRRIQMHRSKGRGLAASLAAAVMFLGTAQVFAQDANALLQEASMHGPRSVQTMRAGQSTFFVPQSQDANERFHVFVWGNGTSLNPNSYAPLLNSIASQCILVAAANTSSAASGRQMQTALRQAMQMFGDIMVMTPRIATSGHSQGGCGSLNAARLIGERTDAIPVQPDHSFTCQVGGAVGGDILAVTGGNDNLAPRQRNRGAIVRNARAAFVELETAGEGHGAPVGRAGRTSRVGDVTRAAAIALLSNDDERRARFRTAFFGPESPSTITAATRGIADADRNAAAAASQD